MAILTESKIRKLLRTTDLKESKVLILEPGTLITPSAKSYLNDVTIVYRNHSEVEEVAKVMQPTSQPTIARINPLQITNQQGHEVAYNHVTFSWNVKIECLIGDVLVSQQLSHEKNKNTLPNDLAILLPILQAFRQLNFSEDNWSRYQNEKKTISPTSSMNKESFRPDNFIPAFTDGEVALFLYRLYTHVRMLEVDASSYLQSYLLFEEYCQLINGCRWMADYIWLLMIQELEEDSKGRRV